MNKYISPNIIRSLLILVLLLNIASCKKNHAAAQSTGSATVTDIRPVGAPITQALSETIGQDGGVVKSEDGRIEIIIPADALTDDTEIGIQVLKNTASSGIGYSYRFTPHGKIFKKKVTVRFHYKNNESQLSNKEALEIAYQNEQGTWICAGGTVNDTIQKTVSVETDHFSDWALIASMELTPTVKVIGLSEKVTLQALRYVQTSKDDDLLIPLTVIKTPSGVPTKLEQKYIVKWTLNGPGKLDVKGNEAVYTAPSTKPANKTATVTVELNVHGKQVLLISTIHIIDEGISMNIDGGDWHTYPAIGVRMSNPNRYGIVSQRITLDLPQINFSWPVTPGQNSNGLYNWSMVSEAENKVIFEDSDPNRNGIYTSIYTDDAEESHDSGGFMSVEEITEGGKKYVRGYFIISNAGLISVSTGKQKEVGYIMGSYKVQRKW